VTADDSANHKKPILYGPDDKPLPETIESVQQEKLEQKARQDKTTNTPKSIQAHKLLLAWILGAATILGAVVVFVPRPIVTQSDPVDVNNSMSASFTITNTTLIPLWHVSAFLAVGQVVPPGKELDPTWVPNWQSRLFLPEWRDHLLGMDERFTITPGDIFSISKEGPWAEGDIAIVINYEPWWLPVEREKIFRFKTHKQTNGHLYWYSVPLN